MSTRYRIEALLGMGAGSRVYRATRLRGRTSETVALKVLQPGVPDEVVARLRDEARILHALKHPAFIQAEQPFQIDGRWVVSLEHVPGETTWRLLRHGPFPARVALSVVAEVAGALAWAWDAPGPTGEPLRLLHRDIKPGNLQISPAGATRILDLGIARAALPSRETRTGAILPGTLGYVAPERRRGVDGLPAEVWALGTVLRVLVTGEQPTRASGASAPPIDGSPEAVRFAGRMLEVDPDARLPMAAVADEGRALAERMPGPTLAEWAPGRVQGSEGRDELCGQVWEQPDEPGLLRRWWDALFHG